MGKIVRCIHLAITNPLTSQTVDACFSTTVSSPTLTRVFSLRTCSPQLFITVGRGATKGIGHGNIRHT